MAVFSTIGAAIANIIFELERTNKDLTVISLQISRDAKDQGATGGEGVPFDSGALGDSGIRTPRQLMKLGMVTWTTPYARRRKYENNKNPQTKHYDVKVWDNNKETYADMYARLLDENIGG